MFCLEFSDICILKALHYVCAFKIWRERDLFHSSTLRALCYICLCTRTQSRHIHPHSQQPQQPPQQQQHPSSRPQQQQPQQHSPRPCSTGSLPDFSINLPVCDNALFRFFTFSLSFASLACETVGIQPTYMTDKLLQKSCLTDVPLIVHQVP